MILGYNTNGFAHHTTRDALLILSDLGYRSAAITLERIHLDPPDRQAVQRCIAELEPLIQEAGLRVTLETGARFVLDPRRKHQPTLISGTLEQRERRIEYLRAAVEIAAALHAESVALWSGAPDDDADHTTLTDRLVGGLRQVVEFAERLDVRLSFEPEPGMLIETMEQFEALHGRVDHPLFGLTLDVGHVHCLGDGRIGDHIQYWRESLWNLHIEDMHRGEHRHLMFGDGDVDFPPVFEALRKIDYAGPVHVELSRHSHDAVAVAAKAHAFLFPFFEASCT